MKLVKPVILERGVEIGLVVELSKPLARFAMQEVLVLHTMFVSAMKDRMVNYVKIVSGTILEKHVPAALEIILEILVLTLLNIIKLSIMKDLKQR